MMRWTLLFLAFSLGFLQAASKPKMVVLLGEPEYHTATTLPHFFDQSCADHFDIQYVTSDPDDRHKLKGIEKVTQADLLVISVWRLAMPKEDLKLIRDYMASDKPVWVMRTSTHGFCLRSTQQAPEGSGQWPEFDREILGCQYNGHASSAYMTDIVASEKTDPLVKGIRPFSVRSWLYRVSPLSDDCKVLLWGTARGSEREPVAWTRTRKSGAKVFCTTLGHPEDFLSREFQMMLYRSVYWCVDKKADDKKLNYRFFNDFLETKVPYTSITFDARKVNDALHPDNLSSRTIWLRAGEGFHIAFDTDLLRPACIWKGEGITKVGMAYGSYHLETKSKKSKQGEKHLPAPLGEVMMSLPLVAGVDSKDSLWHDPRKKVGDDKQLSHGPLPTNYGKWKGLYHTTRGPVLSYNIKNTQVFEQFIGSTQNGVEVLERKLKLRDLKNPLVFHLGNWSNKKVKFTSDRVTCQLNKEQHLSLMISNSHAAKFVKHKKGVDLEVDPSEEVELSIFYVLHEKPLEEKKFKVFQPITLQPCETLWGEEVIVKSAREPEDDSVLVQEEIPLPYMNQDRRNIRAADIAFSQKGIGALVTFDGDVWLFEELGSRKFSWKRFAAGLHEPQGIAFRNDEIFVFDRNGLIRLHDRDGNGEADYLENFCALVIQSSETREFSMGLEVLSDGSFVVAKGGQRSHTLNPHAGAILKISADGNSIQKIAAGLREPYIGIDPKTDAIFASDQQGHWIPTTPFHHIENGANYGFVPAMVKDTNIQYRKPTLFIPHPVLQSGAGILKVHSKKMGLFDQRYLYLGYCKPVLGLIDHDQENSRDSTFYPLREIFDFPLLKAAQSPRDELVYLTGFQIWGSSAKKLSGLCRVKPAKKMVMPMGSQLYKQGVRIDFSERIHKESVLPIAFKLERWNYLRSSRYGSGYYNLKGEAGKETVLFSSLTLSKDRRSVFVAIPDMKESMQFGLSYYLMSEKGQPVQGEAYFKASELKEFKDHQNDFPKIDFKALAIKLETSEPKEASTQFGKAVIERVGCIACHSTSENREGRNGPPWKGLFASQRRLKNGTKAMADENYLKESILNPLAKVSKGYEPLMPPYAGLLTELELESVILYLKSLK